MRVLPSLGSLGELLLISRADLIVRDELESGRLQMLPVGSVRVGPECGNTECR